MDAGRIAGITAAASAAAFYVGDRWGALAAGATDPIDALFGSALRRLPLDLLVKPIGFSTTPTATVVGLGLFCCVWGVYAYAFSVRRAQREGQEQGSASWERPSRMAQFRDSDHPSENIILTSTVWLALRRGVKGLPNRNVYLLGASGCGKTYSVVAANILQFADRDLFVTDPKGTLVRQLGTAIVSHGVDLRTFDLIDPDSSDCWNPLAYVKSDHDISVFVACLIANTNGKQPATGDKKFWDDGEALWYTALITFLRDWYPPDQYTIANLIALTGLAGAAEDRDDYESPLDLLFKEIETGVYVEHDPDAYDGLEKTPARGVRAHVSTLVTKDSTWIRRDGICAGDWRGEGHLRHKGLRTTEDRSLELYKRFRAGAGKTLKSFFISSNSRFAYINQPEVLRVLGGDDGRDDLHLERLGMGSRRKIIFAICDNVDRSLDSLFAILMWQTIYVSMHTAGDKRLNEGGRLPHALSCIFDEFGTIGRLPDIDSAINNIRSRNIDMTIIAQTVSELPEKYGEFAAKSIQDGCATTLYITGGQHGDTPETISRWMGKQTITATSWSRRGGLFGEQTRSRQAQGRDLSMAAELATLPEHTAICLVGNARPYKDLTFDTGRRLPAYRECADPANGGMGEEFDYAGWRAAGRPLGDAARAWSRGGPSHGRD